MIIIILILSVFLPEKFNRGVSVDAKKQKWTEITDRINGLGENHREVGPSVLLIPLCLPFFIRPPPSLWAKHSPPSSYRSLFVPLRRGRS